MDRTVRVLNANNEISGSTYKVIEPPDRKGNFILEPTDPNGRKVRAHPSRLLPVTGGSPAYRTATAIVVKCPKCEKTLDVEPGQEHAKCGKHGKFVICWKDVEAGKWPMPDEPTKIVGQSKLVVDEAPTKTSQRKVESVVIDFESVKKAGELWTKFGVHFDYADFEVRAHVMLIQDGEDVRKLCFNSYNGTWGKKSKADVLKAFIATGRSDDGAQIGYILTRGIDQERGRLRRDGYVRE